MSLLPERSLPRVDSLSRPARDADLAKLDALMIVVPQDIGDDAWQSLPRGAWLREERVRRALSGGATLSARLDNAAHTLLVIGLLPRDASAFVALKLAGQMLKEVASAQATRLGASTVALPAQASQRALEALVAATLAAGFELPSFKSTPRNIHLPQSLTLFGAKARANGAWLKVTQATSEGNNLARWLTALPGNELDARSYRERITRLARREGWRMQFLDSAELKRLGAGAFLAVAQGNETDDAGIVHLQYKPARANAARLVSLVGKGICFDTGGTNLKAHKSMLDMHTDMEGSAVALGTLLALTRLKVRFAVDCWLAITENRIGPRAYKPQDVVKASNGTSIHVIHTDAEGRMVLADALALASRRKPEIILDFATLTGACVNALTERYSGVFTNRPRWRETLERAGTYSGERTWCFPMDEDFDSDLESPLADVLQCTTEGKGDHILAARFLSRFVDPTIGWAHVDLAASQRTGGLAHINTEITGFGVRFAVNLLLEQKLPRERA